jgi:hypothetical protein
MHLGRLKNASFVDAYKRFGFSTKTQLIDAACDELRKKIAQEKRVAWRKQALEDYVKLEAIENVWETIDGEDFKNI